LSISNAGAGLTNISGDLTTINGNLNITDSNTAGTISIGGQAGNPSLTADITNGNVTIQNTANNNGAITLGNTTNTITIHASATAPTLGNVTVADGTFTSKMLKSETSPPANVNYDIQPGGAIYFATSGPAPVFNLPTNNLNALGRAVTLFVGGATGSITVNGNVTLTADPPAVSALSSALQSSAPAVNAAPASTSQTHTTGIETDFFSSINGAISATAFSTVLNPASGLANMLNSGAGMSGSDTNTLGAVLTVTLNSLSNQFNGVPQTTGANAFVMPGSVMPGSVMPASASTSSTVPAILGATSATAKVLYGSVSDMQKKSSGVQRAGAVVKELPHGARLLSADQDTLFETSMGQVFVAKGALALIVCDQGTLSVYNLDDTRSGAVVLTAGSEKITLAPGRHATVTSGEARDFDLVNPIRTLGYRGLSSRKLENSRAKGSLILHSSEFSLPSAIATVAPLKSLISSSDRAQSKVGRHLLKTAAIMQTISTQNVPYQLMAPPQTTAMR
jgi:hypothetical protein